MAAFMAAVFAVSGGLSVPELRVMAQEEENVKNAQGTQNLQEETDRKTVREVMFPYMHTATGSAAESDNVGANDYSRWATTVGSYLQRLENGNFQRVEAINDQVIIEEFSPDYELVGQKQKEYELPIFGGYFCGKDYQFLVFGQSNDEESADKEIMRIVKYDKEWNKLGLAAVCGANTTLPFRAGSLRMAEENGKLFIHTCHQMYRSEDGLRHQANMMYVVAEENMQVEQSWYDIMNIRYGYVSHSFNQFLIVEDGKLYRMDQGDGYPRSIVISKCDQSAISSCGYESVWKIQGEIGDNTTGVSVGGFEKAGKYLVVAGNSCTQESEEAWSSDKTRNIFLTSTNANTMKSKADSWYASDSEEVLEEEPTKKIWLTNYTAADAVSVKTPHLVKASDNLLYVMWEEENTQTNTTTVKIVGVDALGNKITDVASIYGRLSDCKPIYESDGTIQWYTASEESTGGRYDWDENGNLYYIENPKKSEVIFYKVDTDRLGEYQFTEKFDFSEVEAFLENTEFIYDPEKECTPKVVTAYKGAYLEEGRDFSISYNDNEKLGQATVTLKGKGSFSGSKDLNFTIKPRDISGYTLIATPASIVYDGKYHRPECSIYDGEKEVTVRGEYQNQSNYAAGVYTVTFSAIEDYGYTGTLTTTYEITPKDLEEADISLRTSQFTYTGKKIEAAVTVTDDSRRLSKDKDYTVAYENNIVAGEATILLTGIGNYKGTRRITFEIVPADISSCRVSLDQTSYTADGTEKKPEVTVKYLDNVLEPDKDYTLSYVDNIEPGTAVVTVAGIGNYKGEVKKTFTIQKTVSTPTPAPTKKPAATKKPSTTNPPTQSETPATAKPEQSSSPEGDGTQGAVTPNQTTKPVNGENGSQNGTAIKTGTRYKDSVTKAWYQITKASNGKYEAAYLKPVSKNTTTIKIPATIKINGTSIQITSVAKNACSGCKKATKVTIGANVTKIGSKAFYQCSKLKSITIPKKVTKIDTKAFAKNSKLTSITIKATKLTAKSFGSSVFAEIHRNAKITVPKAKKKSYEKILRKTGIKKTVKIAGK